VIIETRTSCASIEDERLAAVANNIVLSLIDEGRRRRRQTVQCFALRPVHTTRTYGP